MCCALVQRSVEPSLWKQADRGTGPVWCLMCLLPCLCRLSVRGKASARGLDFLWKILFFNRIENDFHVPMSSVSRGSAARLPGGWPPGDTHRCCGLRVAVTPVWPLGSPLPWVLPWTSESGLAPQALAGASCRTRVDSVHPGVSAGVAGPCPGSRKQVQKVSLPLSVNCLGGFYCYFMSCQVQIDWKLKRLP